jgi:hypothetical protein
MRAGQLPGVGRQARRQGDGERFLSLFGKPVRSLSCGCERSDDATLAQAFQLITGRVINRMIMETNNRLGKALESGKTLSEIVEELYLAALCRPPTADERRAILAMVERSADRRSALEDVVSGLINSKEFLLRR